MMMHSQNHNATFASEHYGNSTSGSLINQIKRAAESELDKENSAFASANRQDLNELPKMSGKIIRKNAHLKGY